MRAAWPVYFSLANLQSASTAVIGKLFVSCASPYFQNSVIIWKQKKCSASELAQCKNILQYDFTLFFKFFFLTFICEIIILVNL